MPKDSKALKTILKVTVSLLLLYFVFSKLGTRELWNTLKQVSTLHFICAFLLVLASKAIAHLRLLHYLNTIGIKMARLTHWKLYLQGMFYNLFLPGGIGGDAYKAYILSKQFYVKTKKIIGALVVDRLSGMMALGTYTLILVSAYLSHYPIEYLPEALVYTGLLSPLIIAGFYAFNRLWFKATLKAFKTTTLFSFALQGLQILAAYLLLIGLGESHKIWGYLLLFTLSSVVSVLPISLGGIGLRELTFFYGAEWLFIDTETAVALSLLFFSTNALVSLLGLRYHLQPPFQRAS
jgi:uncharacterized membrane protein YbhN (UPF0104 family)